VTYFIFNANPWFLVIALLLLLFVSIEVPYRFGLVFPRLMPANMDSFSVAQAGLLTLASFVLGLSFSQAQARFDARRALVVKEANAIGTTWLRADQLGKTDGSRFRRILSDYTLTRLIAYQTRGMMTAEKRGIYDRAIVQSNRDQNRMWSIVSGAVRTHPASLGLSLLMETLNETIDVSAEQVEALSSHIPTAVVLLTFALVTLGTLSTGFRFAAAQSRPALFSAVFIIANVVVINMMIDYDRPESGFVTINLNPIRTQLQAMQTPP